jgi:hypothetical protein
LLPHAIKVDFFQTFQVDTLEFHHFRFRRLLIQLAMDGSFFRADSQAHRTWLVAAGGLRNALSKRKWPGSGGRLYRRELGCGDSQPSQIAIRSGGLSSHLMLLAEGLQLGRIRISAVPGELSQFLRSPSFWNSCRRAR